MSSSLITVQLRSGSSCWVNLKEPPLTSPRLKLTEQAFARTQSEDIMAAGATLLLLSALLGITQGFYGDSISFMPPKKTSDGAFEMTFYYRQNGKKNCAGQHSYKCETGLCKGFDRGKVHENDQDSTGQGKWCLSEERTTVTFSTSKPTITLSESGCCWVSNVNGIKQWQADAKLNLGTRSDTRSFNNCPVTTTVSSLRVAQNCFSSIPLLAYDPDRDNVRCRFPTDAVVTSTISLDKTTCTLSSTGQLDVGVHVFEVILEDFPTKSINLIYADGTSVVWDSSDTTSSPLCSIKLQFSLEVLSPVPSCEAGHVLPKFLTKTPSHGEVLHANVGQKFQLSAQAQAHHSGIYDFQVSGPQNMVKEFKDETLGKAEVTLSWTPEENDVYRFVPVCFTAETNEIQSEMRCVVIIVSEAPLYQGNAHVTCAPTKMTVSLEKASIPNIDENFLQLNDPSCPLTSNSTHITATVEFRSCGTKVEDKGDYIYFTNKIISFVLPTEVIIRRTTVDFDFKCKFPTHVAISSVYNVMSDYIFSESSFSSFTSTFDVYTDNKFTEKVKETDYPVKIKMLEKIYMGIQAITTLQNMELFVESCKATPDDNPENTVFYDLIKHGCRTDETFKTYSSDKTTFNFEVQAFKFSGNQEQVYVTCSVILCETGNSFSRCAQGCLQNPSRRRRALSRDTDSQYITQGPFQFVRDPVSSTAQNTFNDVLMEKRDSPKATVTSPDTKSSPGSWEIHTNVSTVGSASAFLVALVMVAVVVGYFIRKRKADDRKSLLFSVE
ncbi:hypothetical protein PAMP_000076 [Pampus punctatissimus]